jgi:hypothetical protein
LRRSAIIAACTLVLGACEDKSDPAGPEPVQVTGTYNLQSVNGLPLPFTLVAVAGAYQLDQINGTLTLTPGNTYEERNLLRETIQQVNGAQVTDTTIVIRGTWEVEDSAIILTPQNNQFPLFGLVGVNRLTLNFETSNDEIVQYVYVRGGGSGSRPLALGGQRASSLSSASSASITRRLMTTSSITGLRSTTTSSVFSSGRTSGRTSSARSSSTRASP